MKFLADVNIPLPLIQFLIRKGHDVEDARKEYPSDSDITLINKAKADKLIILTRDKDFLELTKYPKYKTPLIVIRLNNQQTSNIISHIEDLLNNQAEEIISNSITLVREEIADSYPLDPLENSKIA